MKKPLVIAFAVLVPFVGLVVWGLTRPAAEVTPVELSALGGPVARVEPMSPPAPVPTPIAVPVAQPEPTPTPTVAPGSIDARTDPAHLAALASMRPLVDRCFTEHAADLAGRVRVRMNFVVTPDGQVSKPQLKVSTQKPVPAGVPRRHGGQRARRHQPGRAGGSGARRLRLRTRRSRKP